MFVSTRVIPFGGRHYVVMQLDLLRANMCPFIHPVELSTRERRCRPRQGCIPGFEGGIPGYPDPLPSMLMLSELLRLHQFQLVIQSMSIMLLFLLTAVFFTSLE